MPTRSSRKLSVFYVLVALTFSIPMIGTSLAAADAPVTLTGTASPPRGAARTIDGRVRLLTQELDLDVKQQSELRLILERQRDAVQRIWSADSPLAPAERGPATRAAADRTANDIRAMLSEVQRKKYNSPSPQRPPSDGTTADGWIQRVQTARGR